MVLEGEVSTICRITLYVFTWEQYGKKIKKLTSSVPYWFGTPMQQNKVNYRQWEPYLYDDTIASTQRHNFCNKGKLKQ